MLLWLLEKLASSCGSELTEVYDVERFASLSEYLSKGEVAECTALLPRACPNTKILSLVEFRDSLSSVVYCLLLPRRSLSPRTPVSETRDGS